MTDQPRLSAAEPSGPQGWRDISHIHIGRSLAFMAVGALAGLVLAGYALFTARGTSTLSVPAEDVALVNQQPISRVDFIAQLKALYDVDPQHATREQRQRVLDDMIREEIFVQRGKELDVASVDPEVRSAMVNAVELEIASDAISAQPTRQQLQAYYDSHRDKYAREGMIVVRDLVFPAANPQAAKQAADAMQAGGPTPELLARYGAHDSGKAGDEEFYFAARIHLGDHLFAAAEQLPDGRASIPVEQPDGIHVLYVVRNTRPVPLDFAGAYDQVQSDYRNDGIGRLRREDATFLRKRANVLLADDMK
jgi:PPIC-type PPIASE domain/SurA N-terminal domain